MKKTVFFGTLAATTMLAGVALAADGDTLKAVKARGELICGVNIGLTGFGAPDVPFGIRVSKFGRSIGAEQHAVGTELQLAKRLLPRADTQGQQQTPAMQHQSVKTGQ